MTTPFFNAQHLVTKDRYVAWLDVMGSRAMMVRSLATAANFIFKLHDAAISTPHSGLSLYPMNDGMFSVGDDLLLIQSWLSGSLELINASNQSANGDHTKVFLARASVAFGPVAEGCNIGASASATLASNAKIRDAILIGAPVVNAFYHERFVSPFGIYVHESARSFAPQGAQPWKLGVFMRYWIRGNKPPWVTQSQTTIDSYLTYCRAHSNELEFPPESIDRLATLTKEYFDF